MVKSISVLAIISCLVVSCKDNTSKQTMNDTSKPVIITAAGTVEGNEQFQSTLSALSPAQLDSAKKNIASAKSLLMDGMLIMRSDDDYESLTLQNFSKKEKAFSHAGILFKENNDFFVYHSMTGLENPSGTIRRDAFDTFVNPIKKTGFGLFNYQLNATERDNLHEIFVKGHEKGIPFDVFFNLKSDDSLYCSEMIYKSLKKATNNRVVLPTSFVMNFKPKIMGYKFNTMVFKKFEYVALDDLYLNQYCKEVKRVKYK
ncbi:MAG: hypothetical protein RLY16_1034 [Bacteroidota bacterium]|jgi:hypothetical protein